MRIYKVTDLRNSDIKESHYDLSIFVSGYEKRSTFIPQNIINKDNVTHSLILGYKETRKIYSRPNNDKYFQSEWGSIILSGENDDFIIYEQLRNLSLELINKDHLRIVVDYSTMSRLWYSSILNWARFLPEFSTIEIDFLYSLGNYKQEFSPLVIESILALPGYEGAPIFDALTVCVFGLGYDSLAVLGAFDQIEPNVSYGYLASPGVNLDSADKAKKCNTEFINNHARKLLELPLSSVEKTFGSLVELISPHRSKDNIVLIPMGPKPHVLAAMLLCLRFEKEVSCFRVRGKREPKVDVEAAEKIVATRVTLKNIDND